MLDALGPPCLTASAKQQPSAFNIMNMKTILMMTLCSAAILLSGCATSHKHGSAPEYKVLAGNYTAKAMETNLNELARDGWVVVSVSNAAGETTQSPSYTYIVLKRVNK
jgi:hypothetical protein